jgi:hypothetical protein
MTLALDQHLVAPHGVPAAAAAYAKRYWFRRFPMMNARTARAMIPAASTPVRISTQTDSGNNVDSPVRRST